MDELRLNPHEQLEVLKKFCKEHKVTAVSCDAGFLEANLDAQLAKLKPALEELRISKILTANLTDKCRELEAQVKQCLDAIENLKGNLVSIEKARQEERERIIKLALGNDVLCSEENAKANNCSACLGFWQALEEGKK